jgi:hypothetical protein
LPRPCLIAIVNDRLLIVTPFFSLSSFRPLPVIPTRHEHLLLHGRGCIRENRHPRSAQFSGRGSGRTPSKAGFVTDSEYNKLTPEEKKKLYEKRKGISAAPANSGSVPPASVSAPVGADA